MTIEGRHNVPKSGVFILAPTHRSILDTPITASLRRKRVRFMAADKWWKNQALGKLITALGGFPVSRGTADREALKRSIMLIDDGEPLVLFPEGERKSGPEVQPLFDGATYIAMKAGVPIIPVAIGTRMGCPVSATSRPYGDVVVFWWGSEVGAICPPVIP